jgi:hypothetical protein
VHVTFVLQPQRVSCFGARMEALITYILTAMLTWCPVASYYVPYGETEEQATTRMKVVAEDIVTVAMDSSEPPVFSGPSGRLKTALLEASIGSFETSFQKFVDEGKCNAPGFHADRRGNCDGGTAFTFWQIHVFGGGYILLDDGSLSTALLSPALAHARPDLVVSGPQLLADRQTAVRVAQRVIHKTMHDYHSLCGFTGEPCTGSHPKADHRLERAQVYMQQHPFTEPMPEPITAVSKYLASNATTSTPTTTE